jgi:hypothetical protein
VILAGLAALAIVYFASLVPARSLKDSPASGPVQVSGRLKRYPARTTLTGATCAAWGYEIREFGPGDVNPRQRIGCKGGLWSDVTLMDPLGDEAPVAAELVERLGDETLRRSQTSYLHCLYSWGSSPHYTERCVPENAMVVVRACRDASGLHACPDGTSRIWVEERFSAALYGVVDWRRAWRGITIVVATLVLSLAIRIVRERPRVNDGDERAEKRRLSVPPKDKWDETLAIALLLFACVWPVGVGAAYVSVPSVPGRLLRESAAAGPVQVAGRLSRSTPDDSECAARIHEVYVRSSSSAEPHGDETQPELQRVCQEGSWDNLVLTDEEGAQANVDATLVERLRPSVSIAAMDARKLARKLGDTMTFSCAGQRITGSQLREVTFCVAQGQPVIVRGCRDATGIHSCGDGRDGAALANENVDFVFDSRLVARRVGWVTAPVLLLGLIVLLRRVRTARLSRSK